MASPKATNPGRTAQFYRKNKASREKHNRDNNTGGKHDATPEYTRAHTRARRAMNIMGKGGADVVKNKKGQLRNRQSMKINRGKR